MDACEAVEKEIEKVIKKFTDVKGESVETINEIISVFSVLLNSLGKQKIKNGIFLRRIASIRYKILLRIY